MRARALARARNFYILCARWDVSFWQNGLDGVTSCHAHLDECQ